jgi:hypothetical protein
MAVMAAVSPRHIEIPSHYENPFSSLLPCCQQISLESGRPGTAAIRPTINSTCPGVNPGASFKTDLLEGDLCLPQLPALVPSKLRF